MEPALPADHRELAWQVLTDKSRATRQLVAEG